MQAETIVYKNMREYRTWYREKARNQRADRNDEHFVGVDDQIPGTFGYFELVHSDKSNIRSFLKKELNMASDTQGLYEFIQNAADCGSTHFYLFHNEQYLLVLNNGFAFNTGGVRAILNIGQSSVDKQNPGKIGRYGIGFKLVHRLVGAEDGLDELLNDYAGSVLFSWSNTADFQAFLSGQTPTPAPFDPVAASTGTGAPWLFKILATCFPAMPGETVRDLQHRPRIGFPADELADCQRYLATCAAALNPAVLAQGSLFFLRLGQGKSAGLASEEAALQKGVRSALHFLGGLQHIQVQGQPIASLAELELEKFELLKDDPRLASLALSDERDKASNLEVTFGFVPVEKATALLKEEASFYKYFPVTSETSPYTFVLHSNLLSIKSARTDLQPDKTNKALLPLAAALLHEQLTKYTRTDPTRARRIWGGLLLSNEPTSTNDAWQKAIFYDPLLAGLPVAVPTVRNGFRPVGEVKIKQTKLAVELSALGIVGQEWFYWEDKTETARHAARKLDLEEWDVSDLLLHGEVEALDAWMRKLSAADYSLLTKELCALKLPPNNGWSSKVQGRFLGLSFFRFSDNLPRSISSLLSNADCLLLPVSAAVYHSQLGKAGFQVSYFLEEFATSDLGKLVSTILPYLAKPGELYARIVARVVTITTLTSSEKWALLSWFEDLGIDKPTLRKMAMFRNAHGNPTSLGTLAAADIALPTWLKWAAVHPDEINPALEKYLLKKSECYTELIQIRWASWQELIIDNNYEIADFCRLTVEWHEAASNPGHLPGGKTALTANGFQPTTTVFYHPKLADNANYPAIDKAIAALYGWQVPVPEMMPWLGTEPFKLDVDTLAHAPAETLLTGPQVTAWLALAQAIGTRLTDHLTLQAEAKQYRITPRQNGRPRPYHSPDEAVRALTAAHCHDLHPLPLDVHGRTLLGEEAVLKGAELLKELLGELPQVEWQSPETIAVMEASGFSSVVREWLHKLPPVTIELEANAYPTDHPDRRILELAADTLQPVDYADFREKLFLNVPHHNEFCLAGAAEADEIKLETATSTTITLRRSELLPGADQRSELVNQLADRLEANADLRALLGLGEAHDHAHLQQQVLDELATENTAVRNVQQLAYLLLTSQQAEKLGTANVLDQLNVADRTNEIRALNTEWYAAAPDFIDATYVLAPQFIKLPDLLKLGKTRSFVVQGTDFVLLQKPDITATGLQAPGLRGDLNEAGQQVLLTYLYERWEKREQQIKKEDWPTDWTTMAGVPAAQAIGFVPAETVLPTDLATPSEVAPAWLPTWADTNSPNERRRFLAALGVATTDSPVARLRQAFRREPGQGPASGMFGGVLGVEGPVQQRALRQTLTWLCENGVAIATSWHQQLLTELFARLPINDYDFELLVYLTAAEGDEATGYAVLLNADDDLLLDEAARQELNEHHVRVASLIKQADIAGRRVINLRLYPASWQTLTNYPAEPLAVEVTFDRAKLQEEANEVSALADWAAAHPWAENLTNRVFSVPGLLPQLRTLLGQPLPERRQSRLWVDRDEGHLYVSTEALLNLPDVLQAEAPDDFSDEEITALQEALREHAAAQTGMALIETRQELTEVTERAHALANENETLKRELAELRAARQVASAGGFVTDETARRRDGIKGSAAAAEASAMAVAAARELLTAHPDYDCTQWKAHYSVVSGVLYKGQPLKLVVKSATYGNLYLNPFDWLVLAREQPSALLVLTPDGSFRLTPFAAIQNDERNSRFSVNFTLREHTPELLTSLAGFYRELYGETGFVQSDFLFYQPGANYTDSLEVPLRGFFGPSTNPDAGPVSAQSNDVL